MKCTIPGTVIVLCFILVGILAMSHVIANVYPEIADLREPCVPQTHVSINDNSHREVHELILHTVVTYVYRRSLSK